MPTADSKVTVKLDSLHTDEARRDNFIKQNTLQTARFPIAEFVPTAVNGLAWPLPGSGSQTFSMDGNLTVHGVTRPVTWSVDGAFSPSDVSGTASTTVTLDQFGMDKPRVFTVLSIEDSITLELAFHVVKV